MNLFQQPPYLGYMLDYIFVTLSMLVTKTPTILNSVFVHDILVFTYLKLLFLRLSLHISIYVSYKGSLNFSLAL